jgi:hypothetical protein
LIYLALQVNKTVHFINIASCLLPQQFTQELRRICDYQQSSKVRLSVTVALTLTFGTDTRQILNTCCC